MYLLYSSRSARIAGCFKHMILTMCRECLCVHFLKLHTYFMLCTHFEVVTTTVYIAISVPSGSAQFIILTDWKNPSPSQSSLDSFLHPSLSFLCGNWKLAARHRSTNIVLLWPIHLCSLRSASHLLVFRRDSSLRTWYLRLKHGEWIL